VEYAILGEAHEGHAMIVTTAYTYLHDPVATHVNPHDIEGTTP
jgi:hypothetical protein